MAPPTDRASRARAALVGTVAAMLAAMLASCAATPAVNIRLLTPQFAARGAIPFRLTDSVIGLGTPHKGAETPAPVTSFAATTVRCPAPGPAARCSSAVHAVAAPVDFAGATYAIEARSQNFIETRLAPTYATNALRLIELAVEVKDHRIEVINAIGTIAAGIASAQSGGGMPDPNLIELRLPVAIDAADARAADTPGAACRELPVPGGDRGGCHPLPGNPGWSYRLVLTDDPAAQGFIPRARIGDVRDAMVASICRPAALMLDYTGTKPGSQPSQAIPTQATPTHTIPTLAMLTLRLTVADPNWLSTMALPAKGEIVFHPLCGMDVKRQSVAEIGADALTRAMFDQIAAVRAAAR